MSPFAGSHNGPKTLDQGGKNPHHNLWQCENTRGSCGFRLNHLDDQSCQACGTLRGAHRSPATSSDQGSNQPWGKLWQCVGVKGACYYRLNKDDETSCRACGIPREVLPGTSPQQQNVPGPIGERKDKSPTTRNHPKDGRGNPNPRDSNTWRCMCFKGCCYYRYNHLDNTCCFACGAPRDLKFTSQRPPEDPVHDQLPSRSRHTKKQRSPTRDPIGANPHTPGSHESKGKGKSMSPRGPAPPSPVHPVSPLPPNLTPSPRQRPYALWRKLSAPAIPSRMRLAKNFTAYRHWKNQHTGETDARSHW
jgi:hypothetical protein